MNITYVDGEGTLRHVLALASAMGFSASIVRSRRSGGAEHPLINLDVRFLGKQPLHNLVMPLLEVKGVERVSVSGSDFHTDDDSV